MSYDVISEKITPNIYRFLNNSLNVINYYNHTAATFRGLRGQLSSSYQATGGFYGDGTGIGQMSKKMLLKTINSNNIDSLIYDLKENDYNTYFQSSNRVNAPLSVMLSTLGFDKIFGIDDEVNPEKWQLDELTDKDSYFMMFKNIEKLEKDDKKFIYGIYTVGTHVGLDSPDEKYGDGKNPYLNKFYNLDYQFGKFISDFEKSDLSNNTTIIFTADHASYPDTGFVNTFRTKSPYFVDRIPLIIYQKGIKPSTIDANGLNSLTLAPTIADILGFVDMPNHFIGSSLFSKGNHSNFECITAIGIEYYSTCGDKLIKYNGSIIEQLQKLQSLGG